MKRSFGEIHGEYVRQRKADFIFHRSQIIFSDDPNFQHCLQEESTGRIHRLQEECTGAGQERENESKSCHELQNKSHILIDAGNRVRTEFVSKILSRSFLTGSKLECIEEENSSQSQHKKEQQDPGMCRPCTYEYPDVQTVTEWTRCYFSDWLSAGQSKGNQKKAITTSTWDPETIHLFFQYKEKKFKNLCEDIGMQ